MPSAVRGLINLQNPQPVKTEQASTFTSKNTNAADSRTTMHTLPADSPACSASTAHWWPPAALIWFLTSPRQFGFKNW